MTNAPKRKEQALSKELNEPPSSSGMFEDIPRIPKVAAETTGL